MANRTEWRAEFFRLMASEDPSNFVRAVDLKLQFGPTRMFKFCGPTDHAFQNLADDSFWLASPNTLNDPFDSTLVMDSTLALEGIAATITGPEFDELQALGLSNANLVAMIRGDLSDTLLDTLTGAVPDAGRADLRRLLEVLPSITAHLTAQIGASASAFIQRGLKVTCFSEHGTSLLLWAHYADSHRGFCIEYDFADVEPTFLQRRLLFPVRYSVERAAVVLPPRLPADRGRYLPNWAILSALHKSPEWSYEEEWRIVNPDGQDVDGITVPAPKPRAVYAGARMSAEHQQKLDALCAAKQVPLHPVQVSRTKYEVVLPTTKIPKA